MSNHINYRNDKYTGIKSNIWQGGKIKVRIFKKKLNSILHRPYICCPFKREIY